MRIGVVCILFLLAGPAFAQSASVTLELDSRVLEVGERVDCQLVCTNTGAPETPSAPEVDGLRLQLINANPYTSSHTSIINGRMTQKSTYVYQLALTAEKEGVYTLGPISVEVGDAVYETDAVEITVRKTESASSTRGDQLMWVELSATPQALYLSQSCEVTMRIGMRKVEIGGRTIPFELLRDVLDQRASEFSVFAEGQAQSRQTETTLTDSAGKRHRYEVFRFTRTVRAEDIQNGRVGPIFLKANYPTQVRRGVWDRYEVRNAKKVTARADAVPITIKAPPAEGRPEDYTGAIGLYAMDVSAKPTRVQQGQPVTVTIALRGSPIAGAPGPDLGAHADLVSRFDFTTDELVGDVRGGTKTFRRALFPKQVGKQTIPPIRWSFFDVSRECYVTLTSKPIEIVVDPPSTSTPIEPMEAPVRGDGEASTKLTTLAGGILPNYVNAPAVLANQALALTPGWLAALIAPPLLWAFVAFAVRHRSRLRGDVGFARRRRAARRVEQRLKEALRRPSSTEQLSGAAEALGGYVSDRLNLSAAAPTPSEVRAAFESHGVEAPVAHAICEFLEQADAARYMPGATGAWSPKDAVRQVRLWVRLLERLAR